MAVDVEYEAIAKRAAERRQQKSPDLDLWITLPGCDRHGAASAIKATVETVAEDASTWLICPTSPGTYVRITDAAAWRTKVDQIALDLASAGYTGAIDAAPVDAWLHPVSQHPFPALAMAHSVDPPFEAGPFNIVGRPMTRWGVPPDAHRRLVECATEWASPPAAEVQIGSVFYVPVQSEEVPEVLSLLQERWNNLRMVSSLPEAQMVRFLRFENWGRTTWTALDAAVSPVALAERHVSVLVKFAADLDFAAVHPALPGLDDHSRLITPLWEVNRHLGASFVPDAFGIQLLTSAHLARARDLSSWDVEEVAKDRWLVRAKDLSPWFDVADAVELRSLALPTPALRDKARHDFGDMILTEETAEAHPFKALGT